MRWHFWKGERSDQDFAEEVASHLELEAERLRGRGVPADEAAYAARRAFGNVGQVEERFYESARIMFFDRLRQDVRYGLRTLARNPGFATITMLTIGLAIGLNTAVFSVFDAVALKPFALPGDRPVLALYQVSEGGRNVSSLGGRTRFSYPSYTAYRDQSRAFSGMAAYLPEFTVLVEQNPQPIQAQLASCNFFDVLDTKPEVGRGFVPADCAVEGQGSVVVLSHETWERDFNASPSVLGTILRVNRVPLTIVGVAPAGFHGADLVRPAFWAPLNMHWRLSGQPASGSIMGDDNTVWLAVVARLAVGHTADEARAQLNVIAARLDQLSPGRTTSVLVAPASQIANPERRAAILGVGAAFVTAVGLVLLIACANVANLFLVRAAARRREIALRLATGASRGRIIRQLVVESLLVAAGGGLIGVVTSLWGAQALVAWVLRQPGTTPFVIGITMDWRIAVYAVLVVVGTGLAFGLLPALQATRTDLAQALKQDDRDPDSGRSWMRGALLGVQVMACVALLLAAGLMLRGVMRAATVDPGFAIGGVSAVQFDLQREGYTEAQASQFLDEVTRRLSAQAGVDRVAVADHEPLANHHNFAGFGPAGGAARTAEFDMVDGAFFATLNVPFVRGRAFTSAEARSGTLLAVVNETAARQFWPGQDPVGKVMKGYRGDSYTVSGVVPDAEFSALGSAHRPYVFLPLPRVGLVSVQSIVVHARGSDASAATALQALVHGVDPDLHFRVLPLAANLAVYVQAGSALATVAGALGAVALILASIGIYGTVAYTVQRRTREIGIRMALGAQVRTVVALVLRQSMRPVVIGGVAGTALMAVASRVMAPILFGVSPHDAVAFTGVIVFLGVVASAASYVPARRAARVDPTIALRSD